MNCPHCNKVIIVKLAKDSNAGQSTPSDSVDLGELLAAIDDSSLAGAAQDFVRKMRERFDQYGPKTRMSDKQMQWLRDIADGKTGKGDDWS